MMFLLVELLLNCVPRRGSPPPITMTAPHRLSTGYRAHARPRARITLEEGGEMPSQATNIGSQVRTLRLAVGLTQAELAENAGISERTISDLERGQRGPISRPTARRLASALDIAGDQLADFLSDARGGDAARAPAPAIAQLPSDQRARLPVPLTRLLGRESEVATVLELITDPGARLVTLVGPGGIGKTRLAIAVAATAQVDFPGGTFFVSLSDTDDPDMVLPLIATALGLPTVLGDVHSVLARRLGEGRTLVMLDTLEHLVTAAPAIARLLEAAPELTMLATSRSALHLRGEHEVPVMPLPVGRTADDE